MRQETAGVIYLRGNKGPNIGGEWTKFLNALPTRGDGLQGCFR